MLRMVMFMYGIDLNQEIQYHAASLRYFAPREHHVSRFCNDDVLLLVYEGVLRFSEDGISYEVHPGHYHIQKQNTFQEGKLPSDSPKYLFIHFLGQWTQDGALPKRGTFDYASLKPVMEELHYLAHKRAPYVLKAAKLYEILSHLQKAKPSKTVAAQIAKFIKENYHQGIDLNMLCDRFSFSKNNIIRLLKKEFGQTPIAYLNTVRLCKAEEQLITTSESIENIAYNCGYRNYSHFYRQFIGKNLLSPEAYRKRKRLGE